MSVDMDPPVSPACERNRGPILAHLQAVFDQPGEVLEIGSGTGQHAVYFARHLPHVIWHASDRPEHHPGIRAWIAKTGLANLRGPLTLDVNQAHWPLPSVDGVFSANTAHIMHWPEVEKLFFGTGTCLRTGGAFCLYGPFAYDGVHTSESNQHFDASLRQRDPGMGIRDRSDLVTLARSHTLILEADHALPANNRLLIWRKE
ncbi:cyclopropane fatty-acyl-phospholipid synthase-like methyltransferase [Natronospira proteinivora]|uniref:Cyclopropane fatty-acyl-phospholipid synthase-like methyltransferase n=1 Tax=Natronospira proteinivora TaxID=1807133 RepID=A0ABT1G5D6_9GAMM|nr:DUF938 domain-containing protein [Natronospira proteinivora]MCP1726495.1 cyclopropane fatty-acyl-phospholipid synthase-like methyltransferase [Natronospira proteinivora]